MPHVKVYHEIARSLFWVAEELGMQKFQEAINTGEFIREQELVKDKWRDQLRFVLTDRTSVENLFFADMNGVDQELFYTLDPSVYDEVLLFTTPIANQERFQHYNWQHELFNEFMRDTFWDKITEFTNFKEEEKAVLDHLMQYY